MNINIPKTKKIINHNRVDNYYWIQNNTNKIIPYLKKMNKQSDNFIDTDLQNMLYVEFKSRMLEDYKSYPYYENKYYYYTIISKNKNYFKLMRYVQKSDNHELILDCNTLAETHQYFDLGDYNISECNHQILYSVDTKGDEQYKLYLKNILTDNTQLINKDISSNILWFDIKNYIYIKNDEAMRPYQVWIHNIEEQNHTILFEELNQKFIVSIYNSNDDKYIFINTSSKTSNKIYYIQDNLEIELIQTQLKNVLYTIEHNNKFLYMLTNADNDQNFKVMRRSIVNCNWELFVPSEKDTNINEMLMLKEYLVLDCKKNGLSLIQIINLKSHAIYEIEIENKNIGYLSLYINNYNSKNLIYRFCSCIQPNIYYNYNLNSHKTSFLREDLLNNYEPNDYIIKRIKVRKDINLYATICYKKSLFKKNGSNLGYMYGYGSYGITIEYSFNKYIISLLNRGFVYIIAHVRGGGYLGRPWYEKGKLDKKKNSFNDFIRISEYLIDNKYIDKNNLFINGGSAGGLLIGAVINKRPDLYNSAILDVPFLDCLTTMSDPNLPLTIGEYEEWGNPDKKKYYNYIQSYSPIDNIQKQFYPNILITTSLNDTHVGFWEPIKYYAKLKDYNENEQVLLKINLEAGHQSTSERYKFLKEMAFKYAFVLANIY